MATPSSRQIDQLPKLLRQSVKEQIVAGVPLRRIAEAAGVSHEAVRRYKNEVVAPHLDVFPQFPVTPQTAEEKALARQQVKDAVASVDNARAIGEVQAQVIALRKRAENVLTRVESRPDEEFSGREWASVATVAARMIETQGRMTGELSDRTGSGDVNIQINMPTTARQEDGRTIDVDVIKSLKSTDRS